MSSVVAFCCWVKNSKNTVESTKGNEEGITSEGWLLLVGVVAGVDGTILLCKVFNLKEAILKAFSPFVDNMQYFVISARSTQRSGSLQMSVGNCRLINVNSYWVTSLGLTTTSKIDFGQVSKNCWVETLDRVRIWSRRPPRRKQVSCQVYCWTRLEISTRFGERGDVWSWGGHNIVKLGQISKGC